MKKMIIISIAISVFLTLFTLLPMAEESRVYDPDGLLGSELSEIEAILESAKDATRVEFFVYIHSDGYVSEYSMLSHFGVNDSDDVILLEIELFASVYYYELYTYGAGWDLISDYDADYILDYDDVFYSIKGGELVDGISAFTSVTTDVIVENRESERISAIVWPIVIGLLAGGGAVIFVVVKYKRKLKSPSYPLSKYATLNLTYSDDSFLGSNVTRTRINTSSGGGGGRRGGSRGRR